VCFRWPPSGSICGTFRAPGKAQQQQSMNLETFDSIRHVQIHIPFHLLRERYLPMVLKSRLQPEIGFNYRNIDRYDKSDFIETAKQLSDSELKVTFHAPFHDLRPGALDSRIRQLTIDRLKQVFDLIPYFRPMTIVCHPAFDAKYYVSAEEEWLENSADTWRYFLSLVEGTDTIVTLENVYEKNPGLLKRLLTAVPSPQLRFCFDTGHFNTFSKAPLQIWLKEMTPWLSQLHIHDNDGSSDEHLAVGEGTFPFPEFFREIHRANLHPIVTIEAHSEKTLLKTLDRIEKTDLLKMIRPSAAVDPKS
jgi:sugar phosphate isomerase/epimerase